MMVEDIIKFRDDLNNETTNLETLLREYINNLNFINNSLKELDEKLDYLSDDDIKNVIPILIENYNKLEEIINNLENILLSVNNIYNIKIDQLKYKKKNVLSTSISNIDSLTIDTSSLNIKNRCTNMYRSIEKAKELYNQLTKLNSDLYFELTGESINGDGKNTNEVKNK